MGQTRLRKRNRATEQTNFQGKIKIVWMQAGRKNVENKQTDPFISGPCWNKNPVFNPNPYRWNYPRN